MSVDAIYHFVKIDERTLTSGQPTEEQLRAAAEQGVQVVINLATLDSESAFPDEAILVRSLGMAYHHIPVVWTKPAHEDFTAFLDVMRQVAGKVILIHCAANYRATAFYGLYAMAKLGWAAAQADALMDKVWQNDTYPVWHSFIQHIREQIQHGSL